MSELENVIMSGINSMMEMDSYSMDPKVFYCDSRQRKMYRFLRNTKFINFDKKDKLFFISRGKNFFLLKERMKNNFTPINVLRVLKHKRYVKRKKIKFLFDNNWNILEV